MIELLVTTMRYMPLLHTYNFHVMLPLMWFIGVIGRPTDYLPPLEAAVVPTGIMKATLQGKNIQANYISGSLLGVHGDIDNMNFPSSSEGQ